MIKKLARSVREFKAAAIATPITVTFEVIMEVVIPTLMAALIDKGVEGGNMNYILKMGLILVGCCALSLTFGGQVCLGGVGGLCAQPQARYFQ